MKRYTPLLLLLALLCFILFRSPGNRKVVQVPGNDSINTDQPIPVTEVAREGVSNSQGALATGWTSPGPGQFWSFLGEPEGNPKGLETPLAGISRGNNLLPSGKRYRIASFPDLRSLREGEHVEVKMPDGRAFVGRVNWSRKDEGYDDTHQVSIGFVGDKGGLVAIHDAVNSAIQGRLFVEGDRFGWTLEPEKGGGLWLVEHLREDMVCEIPAAAAARSSPLPGDATAAGSGTVPPTLNSRGSATATLYMDFDGQSTRTYPDWPTSNPGGVNIAVPHSGLTADQMTTVWRRVAEDFAPFNVNVTTENAKYTAAPVGRRMRILISINLPASVGGAGLALMRSFQLNSDSGYSYSSNIPCWLQVSCLDSGGNQTCYGNPATMSTSQFASLASNVSHEFGHTLGLWHDGNDGIQPADIGGGGNYYPGHGPPSPTSFDWSPIMGSPYRSGSAARSIIQWAKNDYPGANNTQDDLAVIAGSANGFGYTADENPGYITANILTSTGPNQIGGEGVIMNRADFDWWLFTIPYPGPTTIEVTPADLGVSLPNLDCGFRVENGVGDTVIEGISMQDNLEAKTTVNLPPGTYYVVAYGTGNRDFSSGTGYNDYGSIGRYLVTVDLPPDDEDPVPVIQSPVAGVLGAPSLQFNGTATDNDRVSGFSIFLRRNADNAYWNGSYWQVGSAGPYWNGSEWGPNGLARDHNQTTGVWTCTAPLPQIGGAGVGSLNVGSYNFIAIAEDPAGHSKQVDVTVTVDSAGPTLTILSPTVTLGNTDYSFNGTSQDSNGVASVGCFIRRDSDGKYWDGSGWEVPPVSLSTNHVPNNTGGSHPWTCDSPNLPQPGGQLTQGTYTFIVRAADPLGNQSQMDSVVLIDDNSPPQVTVTTPPHNSYVSALTSISGTATDLSGIQQGSVEMTIYQDSTGNFWNGSDWVGSITALHASQSGINWSYNSPPAGSKLSAGKYYVSVHARDNANTLSAAVTGVNQTFFNVDLAPPTVSIATPLDGATISALPSVSGLADDANGISTVRLYLYRYEDGKFWDGSSWGGGGSAILPTSSGGGTWSSLGGVLPVPGPISNIHLTNGTYDIIAFAVDSAGNQTRADSVVTVDYHPVYTWTGSANNDWDNEQNWLSSGTVLVGQPDYDAVTGFSPSANNTTQRWQYGYTATDGTGFSNLSNPGTHTSGHSDGGTVPVWNEPAVGDMGVVFNSTDHVFHYNSGTYQPMDELGMFPNSDGRKAVVRWTAPTAGQYNFIGWFVGIESAGGGTTSDATIVLNASTNSPQPLLFHAGDASDVNYVNGYRAKKTFSFNLTLSAGATLDFRVGLGSNNNYSYDGTGLKAIIIPGAPIVESQLSGVPDANAVAIINAGSPTIPAGAQRQVYKLVMNGGVFTQGELTALKKFEWTGGQIWGTINVASQAALEISGANPKYVIAYGLYAYGNVHAPGILNNAGTATWTGLGDIQIQWKSGSGGSINNSGTWHIQTDADMTNYNGGAFVNTGSVDKAASSDATRLDVVVTNGGTMRADTGRLVFAGGGGVSTGEFQLTSVNCLEWAGGTHTLGTGARFTGAGRALISGGTVLGAADTPAGPALVDFAPDAELELATGGNLDKLLRFTGSGQWRWTGGIVWGNLDVTSNMRVAVAGSDPKHLIAYNFLAYGQTDSKGIINHAGTATWEGSGEVNLQWGAKIVSTGSLTIISDADMTNYNGGSFVNQGLLSKAGSGGDTLFNGVVFSSPGGTLDVQTGVVSLASHGSHSFDTGTQLTGAGRTRIDSATLTVNGAIGGTGHLELTTNSALGGAHEFTAGTFHWTGGSIIGTTTVGAAAFLDISGAEAKVLQAHNLYNYGNIDLPGILNNNGTAVWSGTGDVNIQWAATNGVIEGGTFRNAGTLSILTDADMTVYIGGRFVNTGTLIKDLSTDVTRFDVACSNYGTLFCQSGKVQINGGGTSSGRFDMPIANSLAFTGGTNVLAHGASFTSSGRARITGGTVAFANTLPNDVTLGAGSGVELASGGTLSRDGSFIGSGTFQFTGGVISGTTNFNGTTVFEISGPDQKYFDAYGSYAYGHTDGRGTVNVNSSAVWSGAGGLRLNWGSCLRNNGLFDLQSDTLLDDYVGGTFYNAGTLRKSVSAGMSRISGVVLNNTGALDMQTGVLSLVGSHTLNPGTSLTGAGRLRTDGGLVTVTGNVTGAGHFEHSVGTLAGTHTFTAATMYWTGGAIEGVTTVGPSAVLDISGPVAKYLQGYNLYNYGNTAAPGILNNQGTATWTGTGEIQTQWASGAGARFNNSGTFRVQTTARFSEYVGGSFVNSGQLVVGASPGVFNIRAGFTQTSSGVLNVEMAGLNAATPEFDQIKCLGACTLGGTLNVTLLNGFNPTLGDNFPVMTYASRTGEFATFNSPGAYFSRNYNAGDLTLTATNAPSTLAEWKAAYFAPGSPESASDADPDRDGLSNFAEFVFNTNPLAPSPVPQDAGVETIDGQQWLTLGYRRWANPSADGVVYTPEVGTGLGSWGTGGIIDEVDPNAPVIPGSTACRCRVLMGGPAKFLRVKATKP